MHRLLVAPAELERDEPVLSRDAVRHMAVLRLRTGEEVELFDGRGHWRTCRYDAASGRLSAVAPIASCPVPAAERHLILFACVTKGSRWDWTIEKATELGASTIVPVLSEHTIVRIAGEDRGPKRERWMRIAEEAARQSDAKWLPEIVEPMEFADVLERVRSCDCYVGALTTPPPMALGAALKARSGERSKAGYGLFVGPEGDFTPEELATLLTMATPVSFGSTILRAETAAIYGLSVLKAWLDAM